MKKRLIILAVNQKGGSPVRRQQYFNYPELMSWVRDAIGELIKNEKEKRT